MSNLAERIDAMGASEYRSVPDEPIDHSILYKSRQKNVPRHFGFFPFFAKKPWQVVQTYIKHYSNAGDLVCDPFAGSGVTAVEALVLRRRAVASDINPVARFITQMTAITPVNLELLDKAYEQVSTIAKRPIEALDTMSERDVSTLLQSLEVPGHSIPSTIRRAGAETIDQLHTPRQLAGLSLLRDAIERVDDALLRDLLKVALANTAKYTNKMYSLPLPKAGEKRRAEYTGDALFMRRFSYSLASDNLFYELRVWPTFERTFKNVFDAKKETNSLIGDWYNANNFSLAQVPASRIHEVTGEQAIDYCFTDPPYSNDIHFLDLSTLWAAWLGMEVSDETRRDELLIGGTQRKTREQFVNEFSASMASIARALRQDRWFTLVYKHRDIDLWQNIVTACEESGLQYVNAVWQNTTFRSTRQIESPNTNPAGDMYLNFRKMPRARFRHIYGSAQVLDLPTKPNYVQHEIERVIVAYLGADIELITSSVIRQILDSRAFRNYNEGPTGVSEDIQQALNTAKFTTWQPPRGRNQWVIAEGAHLDASLPLIDRTRYYVFEWLRTKGTGTQSQLLQYVLTRLAEERVSGAREIDYIDIAALLRSVSREVEPHLWQFDVSKVADYKQLRLFFASSKADKLREQIERRNILDEPPLRLDLDGLALLRDRLQSANHSNDEFDTQYTRLLEVLNIILGRLKTKFEPQVERVLAIGDWARYGVDLRNLPLDDVVIRIILRSTDKPFAFYRELADQVFTNLEDDDILVQFVLETLPEWQHTTSVAKARGQEDALGVSLMARIW